MAEGLAAEAKAGTAAIKRNWLFFLLAFAALVFFVLWYEHKHGGKITAKLAGLPVIGKAFACLALVVGAALLFAPRMVA